MGAVIAFPRRKCEHCGRPLIPVFADQRVHPVGCGDEAYWEMKWVEHTTRGRR